jgi:threonine dehydrogenase-like Zn-dependent dehydrogenase
MRAIMCHGPEDYRLEEVPVPEAGPGEIVARILGVGICASDIKCHIGAPLFWGDGFREGYCQPPVIPGHEFVGEVVAMGEESSEKYGLSLGEQVISEQIVPCWECRYCLRGQYWMCQIHNIYGFRQATFGAMAEYMKFPAGALNYKVPKTLKPQEAVYIEPLACAIHAVQRGEIEFGNTVVIAGCGPLGLGMIVAARLKNPGCLVAIDLEDQRLEVAKRCGADVVLNPRRVDVIEEVRKLTNGYGCDVYIEVTGHPVAVEQGLHMICKLGTFVEFSVMREPVTVDWTIIGDTKELDVHGAHLGPYCYPLAIDMLVKGQVPTDAIVTHQLPFEDFQEGLKLASSGTESIKVMLVP